MAGKKLITSASGFVQDIDQISVLSSGRTNARVLSDRTLYILQNLANLDVNFPTRYGTIEDGGLYIPIGSSGTDFETFTTVGDAVRRDLSDMTFEQSLECICSQLSEIAGTLASSGSCGCVVGEGSDSTEGEEGGSVPRAVGSIEFQEPVVVTSRECKAANLIHETLRDAFDQLDQYPIEDWAELGLVFSIGIVAAVLAALAVPTVALLIAVAGAISIFTGKMIISTVSLADIVTELDLKAEELVCLLYNSTSVVDARDDYLALLTGLTSLEVELVSLLMSNAVMNLLFFDTAESAAFWPTYTSPISCDTCGSTEVHIAIMQSGGVDQGAIVGPNRFLVGDTVEMTSITDQDCLPTSRHAIAFEVLDGVPVRTEVELSTVLTSWSVFPIEAPCEDRSNYWGAGFESRQFFTNTQEPTVTDLDNVAIVALRSGDSFSVEVTRVS